MLFMAYKHLLAFGIVSCLADESSCTSDSLDVSFLQVQQNLTVQTVPALHNLTWPAMLIDNISQAWGGQLLQVSSSVQSSTGSFGSLFLDLIIIVVIIALLVFCVRLVMAPPVSSAPKRGEASASSGAAGTGTVTISQSQVARIPVLCQQYVVTRSESQFLVDMGAIMDQSRPSFEITSTSGTKLLEASLSEGRMLSITAENSEGPKIMLRASTADENVMLTVMDERGAYVGKIAAGPAGYGLIFYYMQKPCATIKAENVSTISLRVQPLSEDCQDTVVASTVRKGNSLRIQVAKDYDGCLFLGTLLGLVVLEPALLQLAAN
mmetsp:Transcript_133906/g.317474  ORF Transcript_133906/g.317474 Transcript_133906/m.317474 type:complete len:322 (-) Transcript_133906:65-1030(-)